MKATGVVRRIDDLGRVVIPKDIRRTMRIHDGDPMEIYVENPDCIIFKKYHPISALADTSKSAAVSLHNVTGRKVIICNRDYVVSTSGFSAPNSWIDRPISDDIESIMFSRKATNCTSKDIAICESLTNKALYVKPIFSDDAMMEIYGAVIIVKDNENDILTDAIESAANVAASMLGKIADVD